MELDYEKASAGANDGWGALVVVAILFSAAVHVGLMVKLSDCPFAPLPMPVKNDKRWTKDMPVMQMQKMAEDPMAVNLEAEMPPPAPPEVEKQEDRVDRLSDAAAQAVVPEMPAPVAEAMPKSATLPEPAPVAPAEWQPRQEILAVELPTVPDEAAALPRIVIPSVPRVKHAADITPEDIRFRRRGEGRGARKPRRACANAAAGWGDWRRGGRRGSGEPVRVQRIAAVADGDVRGGREARERQGQEGKGESCRACAFAAGAGAERSRRREEGGEGKGGRARAPRRTGAGRRAVRR